MQETTSAFYPVMIAAELLLSLLAITKLSVIRYALVLELFPEQQLNEDISTRSHVMLTSFCALWTRGVPISFLSPSGGRKALGKSNAVLITVALVGAAYLLDSVFTGQ